MTEQTLLSKNQELEFEKICALYEEACDLRKIKYDFESFFIGFLLGRKEEENKNV